MALERIHSFLVHPSKADDEQPLIGGTSVPKHGKLSQMLSRIYDRAATECDIEIVFQPDAAGQPHNDCRRDLIRYIQQPTMSNGRTIASRLQAVTTHRSGLGLLFLMTGRENATAKLVVSRFPADQGVVAEENKTQLSVEFIERVFMKSAKAYKSAFYESDSIDRGFWDGRAVDRQVSGPKELSDYWIREFLLSDLRTTGPAGTKRIAVALRGAVRTTESLTVRQELISAAGLLRGRHGKVASARQLVDQLGLSTDATEALERQLPRPELMDETFRFDRVEFDRHVFFRLVELDNGAILLAEDGRFPEVFERTDVDSAEHLVRFETQGHIVDERLRKSR